MKISWAEPGVLAAGGIPLDAKDVRALRGQGVRAILTLTERPLTAQREITPALLAELDILAHHVPVPDQRPPTDPQAREILRIAAAMAAEGRPLLVHCHAGVGRTGTALHLYEIGRGRTFDEARAAVRRYRVQCILLSDEQEAFVRAFRPEGSGT